jgi:hypothetical protein
VIVAVRIGTRRAVGGGMRAISLLLACAVAAGCTDGGPDDEWGMEGPLEPSPPAGKEDSQYHRGLLVATDTSRTQVWTVRNQWDDRTTAAAREAGMAWPANSGLSWDEKYQKWVESMEWIPAVDGYYTTIKITTPWGKTIPSPYLECAEMAMFLRISFAAWYRLPLQFVAVAGGGQRIYFGHFGVRTTSGRYANTPEFAISYRDHSATNWQSSWPRDNTLRQRKLYGGTDEQLQIGPGAVFGAVLDDIHLNKRAGYFTALTINYLGSANLADTNNTYNLVPEAVSPGDVLLHRWQRQGIGHTLVVKEVKPLDNGSLDVGLISGSMPRRQGVREAGSNSKSSFTTAYAGGPGKNSAGEDYARLGGGLKRFRITKNVGGHWTNTWASGDEAHWINSTDLARIAARPERFGSLLGQVSPEQQRTELLSRIEDARRHLSKYPASCAARERRENAFRALYELSHRTWGQSKAQVDDAHRQLADYVFAELEYSKSKTCCWNSTTSAMADLILLKAEADKADADARGVCEAPVVFQAHSDGYQRWATFAASLGRASEWRAWSEDESCPQANVAADTQLPLEPTPFCSL